MFLSGRIPVASARSIDSMIEAGREHSCEMIRSGSDWVMELPSWEGKLMPLPSRFDLGAGWADRVRISMKEGELLYRWIYWTPQQILLHLVVSALVLVSGMEGGYPLLAMANLVVFALSFALVQYSWARVVTSFKKKISR